MGGLGKTTLAQLLHNDDTVKRSFDIKAWVCVSDEFDVFKTTVKITEGFDSSPCDAKDLNKAQEKLRDTLKRKKFLLILDDVWNENYMNWADLIKPFAACGSGSKVLITTRNESVATTAGAVSVYNLKKLKPEECLSLLACHALGEDDFSRHTMLQEMGEEIAKKCDGLPLAAKAIGGLLRGKSNPTEWLTVLNTKMWEFTQDQCPVMPALRISYHYLPSHLKRCFAYCAIFPKDYEFKKDDLISWWMAEGYLEQSDNFMKVGDGYFKDLLARSFFQPSTSDEDSKFVMHDLMNDLAMWISGGICLHLPHDKESIFGTNFGNLRHLSFISNEYEVSKRFEKFSSSTRLRTFIAFKNNNLDYFLSRVILDNVSENMRCLKLLCLRGYNICELPDSISKLEQLRHLDMSFTEIRCLPESIIGLLNLQVLKLNGCRKLIQLPGQMRKLISLKLLDISGTLKLERMPLGIGRLTNLQILSNFIIGENHGLRLKELKGLSLLKGELSISKLENVIDIQDARDANLKLKEGLISLKFYWGIEVETRALEKENQVQILSELQPHTGLKNLEIEGYYGKHFPKWVGDCSFTKLETFSLFGCKSASSLPALGGLISLKTLKIAALPEVKRVGKEFWGNWSNSNQPFPSLETLILREMNELEEWCSSFGCGDGARVLFPRLQKMDIRSCPRLVVIFPNQLLSLGELIIKDCSNLTNLPNQLPSLVELIIENCSNLTNLPNQLPLLRELRIEKCPNFTNFECMHPLLQKLVVGDCSAVALKTMRSLCSLEILVLKNIRELSCMDDGFLSMLGAIEELDIEECRELKNLVRNGKGIEGMVGLKSLCIRYCHELEAIVGGEDQGWHCLPSLESLEISSAQKLVSFGPMRLPSSLKSMKLSGCNALRCLPEGYMMDGSSPSEVAPEMIQIGHCLSLSSFARGGFPRQLATLIIEYCTNLEIMPEISDPVSALSIIGCSCLRSLPRFSSSLRSLHIADLQSLGLGSTEIESSLNSSYNDNVGQQLPLVEGTEIGSFEEMELEKRFADGASSIEELKITELNMRRLPENITSFPRMKVLEVWGCKNLRGLPKQMQELTCLRQLIIELCPDLELSTRRDLPQQLTLLSISSCDKVVQGLFDGGLSSLSSLTVLSIGGSCIVEIKQWCPAVLPKLGTLWISNLRNLESLAAAFELSPSIEKLCILECPKLRELPVHALQSSLEWLLVIDCPLLKQRFVGGSRAYRRLLSVIPRVTLDPEYL